MLIADDVLIICFFLQEVSQKNGKASVMPVNEYSDALHNFILSQKLTTLLGNFPEVNALICVNADLQDKFIEKL